MNWQSKVKNKVKVLREKVLKGLKLEGVFLSRNFLSIKTMKNIAFIHNLSIKTIKMFYKKFKDFVLFPHIFWFSLTTYTAIILRRVFI